MSIKRVSTHSSRGCRGSARDKWFDEYERLYVDQGYTGTQDRRPALDRLMADARKRRFHVAAVWRFDRFGRSLRHLVTALDEFRDLGIEFVSTQDGIDTGTAPGRLMFAVVGAMAQFEAELVRERTIAGLAAARRRGVRLASKRSKPR